MPAPVRQVVDDPSPSLNRKYHKPDLDLVPLEAIAKQRSPESNLLTITAASWGLGVLAGNSRAWWMDYTAQQNVGFSKAISWYLRQAKPAFYWIGSLGTTFAFSRYILDKAEVTDYHQRAVIPGVAMGAVTGMLSRTNKWPMVFAGAAVNTLGVYWAQYLWDSSRPDLHILLRKMGYDYRPVNDHTPVFGVAPPDLKEDSRIFLAIGFETEDHEPLDTISKRAVMRERREYS